MQWRKYINCPALLIWRIFAFTVSFIFKFAFTILRAFIGSYLDTKSFKKPKNETKQDIIFDKKGQPILTDENGMHAG